MTTTPRPLAPGDIVMYRKVGKVRLIERASDHTGSTWEDWRVEFVTGPRKYRELAAGSSIVWVHADARTRVEVTQ